MRSSWVTQVHPKSSDKCPYRDEDKKTEAEIGGLRPQTEEHREHQKLKEAWDNPPMACGGRLWPCRHPDFRLLASRAGRE